MIMTVQEFKGLTKSNKAVRLKELRGRYSDKDIRDSWGMKYDAYNYYLIQLGLKEPYGKRVEKNENVAEKQRANAKGSKGSKGSKFIDIEHKVINEIFEAPAAEKQIALAHQEVAATTDFSPMLNFPAVVGNAAQLRKRIESYLAVLECEGEDAIFQMKFIIDRK